MINTILVAVDESPAALAAARLAVELASTRRAKLHAVAVVPPEPASGAPTSAKPYGDPYPTSPYPTSPHPTSPYPTSPYPTSPYPASGYPTGAYGSYGHPYAPYVPAPFAPPLPERPPDRPESPLPERPPDRPESPRPAPATPGSAQPAGAPTEAEAGAKPPPDPAQVVSAVLGYVALLARDADVPLQTTTMRGNPAQCTLAVARGIKADLIVMGRSSRATAGQPHVGSQAREVLGYATIPVTVVPEGA